MRWRVRQLDADAMSELDLEDLVKRPFDLVPESPDDHRIVGLVRRRLWNDRLTEDEPKMHEMRDGQDPGRQWDRDAASPEEPLPTTVGIADEVEEIVCADRGERNDGRSIADGRANETVTVAPEQSVS